MNNNQHCRAIKPRLPHDCFDLSLAAAYATGAAVFTLQHKSIEVAEMVIQQAQDLAFESWLEVL